MRDILAWIITVEIVGLAVLPLLRRFFGNRRDAALLSRTVGVAVVGYVGWLIAYGVGFFSVQTFFFSRPTLSLALLFVAIASFRAHRRQRAEEGPQPFWGPEETRAARYFWIPVAVFLLIRAAVPEVIGQEKFMDLAFLNSITRNAALPPLDPWMSGHSISYYYWGYLLVAGLTKGLGISTFYSYNLAIATFAGLAFAPAAALGFRLSDGRRAAAVGAGFGAVFAGNLAGALDAWRAPFSEGFNYFAASRVIGGDATINEFPFFTFFQADLHPHLLAFPFFIAAFTLAHRLIEMPDPPPGPWLWLRRFPPLLLVAVVAGTAIAANKWNAPAVAILLLACSAARLIPSATQRDLPALFKGSLGFLGLLVAIVIAYAILQVVASIVSPELKYGMIPALGVIGLLLWLWPHIASAPTMSPARTGTAVGALFALLLVTTFALFQPYELTYHLPFRGVERTTQTSGMMEFFGVWGLFFAVLIPALWPRSDRDESGRRRANLSLAVMAFVALVAAFSVHARPAGSTPPLPTPVLFPILFLCGLAAREIWLQIREEGATALRSARFFCFFLLLLGLAMITGCEFLYFRDAYGDRLQRMNTIFKFYHQAWPLLAIATAVLAERRWREARAAAGSRVFRFAVASAGALALFYPIQATVTRLRQHQGPWTLESHSALVRRNRGDAAAIDWLRRLPGSNLVLLEATGDPYTEFARISTHTGIPTVMGWVNHEELWRENDKEVAARANAVRTFYSSQDTATIYGIIRQYRVSHVVIGELESRTYPEAEGVTAFPFLKPAFPGATSIFQVVLPQSPGESP
jgi:YYY domain-containing protein